MESHDGHRLSLRNEYGDVEPLVRANWLEKGYILAVNIMARKMIVDGIEQ